MTDVDLLVIGGGPVGLVTAIEARRAGLSVLLAEPRSTPVDKACGEGLMPSAREALAAIGVAPKGRPFTGITYLDEQGCQADADFPGGSGLGVRRLVLHEALAKQVADSGAETASASARLRAVRPTHVDVEVGDRCIRASFVAGADGLHSSVRRDLGLDVPSGNVRRYGLRQHWQAAPWSDRVEVYWGPGAELYVTPVADDMVGVAVLTSIRGPSMVEWLSAFPALRERLGDAPACSTARGAGPLAQRARRRTAGRVLLVGDAAGYVDAITGEGLAVGFPMAAAAVAAVVAEDPQQYERDWRRITRRSRLLTRALLAASQNPAVRGELVGSARRLPAAFRAAVAALA